MQTYSTPGRPAAPARGLLLALLLLALLLPPAAFQPCRAEALGRLFFTPAERAAVDRPPDPRATPAPPPRLDGIVSPRSGTPTLFLDGRPRPASPQQIRLGDASADVRGEDGRLHRLRVGAPPDAPTP